MNKIKRICSTLMTAAIFSAAVGGWNVFAAEGEILYSENFEGQTVDSVPTTVYSGTKNELYSNPDKTLVEEEYATVKNDSTAGIGNYLEIYPFTGTAATDNLGGSAKIFLNKPMSKNDGTIVVEFDGFINLVSNPDGCKRFNLTTYNGKSLSAISLVNCKGGDRSGALGKNNTHGFSLNKYDPLTGKNTTSGLFSNDGSTLMLRENKAWNHYRFEINLNEGSLILWLNGKKSEKWYDQSLYSGVANGSNVMESVIFQNFNLERFNPENDKPWMLDNIRIYKLAPDPRQITVNTYDGKTTQYDMNAGENTISDEISTMLSDMEIEFGVKLKQDTLTAELKNVTTGSVEPVSVEWNDDGLSARLSVDKKYLDANSDYSLTLNGEDIFGNSFTKPTVINFKAANDGGLAILSTDITKNGGADFTQLASGDVVMAKITYILTDETMAQNDVILAVTGEKENKICAFKQSVTDLNLAGSHTVSVEFNVGDVVPDTVSAFLWSAKLRQPIVGHKAIAIGESK